jgi:hypothetical protein
VALRTKAGHRNCRRYRGLSARSRIVVRGSVETLIQIEPGRTGRYQPMRAVTWKVYANRSVLTVNRRDGVVFQDGTPPDKEDVRRAFVR